MHNSQLSDCCRLTEQVMTYYIKVPLSKTLNPHLLLMLCNQCVNVLSAWYLAKQPHVCRQRMNVSMNG